MKFLGVIEKVVPDYKNEDGQHGRRFYMKLVACDELLRPQSIYVRIQGRNANKVLAMMDEETGVVHGIWQAELAVHVAEYQGNEGRTIYANLIHCTKIELVDADFPDCHITDDDRAMAVEIIPIVVDGETTPCLLQRKKAK